MLARLTEPIIIKAALQSRYKILAGVAFVASHYWEPQIVCITFQRNEIMFDPKFDSLDKFTARVAEELQNLYPEYFI